MEFHEAFKTTNSSLFRISKKAGSTSYLCEIDGWTFSMFFWLALPVGNEGINLYIGILGMKLPSFPTKGQLVFNPTSIFPTLFLVQKKVLVAFSKGNFTTRLSFWVKIFVQTPQAVNILQRSNGRPSGRAWKLGKWRTKDDTTQQKLEAIDD